MMTATTLLETCHVSPPPAGGATSALSMPLSFFDIIWIHFHPMQRLLFYSLPCSESHFSQTILPNLKQSLALTLQHHLPLSGNLLYPSSTDDDDQKPVFRYLPGDSVSLTVAVSGRDFDDLVEDHPRDSDQFYDFVPKMPPVKDEPGYKIVPLLALQVTLFPDRGVCIGYAYLHSIGDGSSIFSFMKTWSSLAAKHGEYAHSTDVPIFDRSVINDPLGIDAVFWKFMRGIPFTPCSSFALPTKRVRATFTLHQPDIEKLKDLVLAKKPGLVQVSSFVVTMSYVWTCLVKSWDKAEQEEEEKHLKDFFIFVADARARVDPPIPGNYFGNCLVGGCMEVEHNRLVGEEGFLIAAEVIAEEIKNRVNKKGEALKGAENWLSWMGKVVGRRGLSVSGSPRFDMYSVDFGWGKARKVELVSSDGGKYSISFGKSRDSNGGLEIGLSLPKETMEAFGATFAEGLSTLIG